MAGAVLSGEEAAITAGSHTGEDRHVAVVDRMLASAGLDRGALACPPDLPEDEETRNRLIAAGIVPSRVLMNCSGKHAAMLAATVAAGNDTSGYLDPASPVQKTITAEIERLTGATTGIVTVDGCGAPLIGVPLRALAVSFGRLATAAAGTPEHQVAEAMRHFPEYVGGRGHPNSLVMQSLPGAIAKGGAEGVIAMAAPDGHAVAVKVIDGGQRATTALGLTLLQHVRGGRHPCHPPPHHPAQGRRRSGRQHHPDSLRRGGFDQPRSTQVGEPEGDLAIGGLRRVRAVHEVLAVDSDRSPRMVPGAALRPSVAPLSARTTSTASSPSRTSATIGPLVTKARSGG